MKPIIERDEKGRVTHERFGDGTECWYDYEADGRMTHYRWSDGTEWDQEGDDEEEDE